jgi:fatty-acyl-CoA synthase
VVTGEFNVEAFRAAVATRLPPYARPVFLRLLPALEASSTFKPLKQELVAAGFDPAHSADPLYFDDRCADAYVPLDSALYGAIAAGRIRV